MKICISNKYHSWDCARTGKGRFAQRLIAAITDMGHDVTTDPAERVDVDLQFSKRAYDPVNADRSVIRQGPAHIDTNKDYRKLNKEKHKAIKASDGVIYQSEYSRRICDIMVGKADCPHTVILNGAPPLLRVGRHLDDKTDDINFFAIAREWIPQKRLDCIITAFKCYLAERKDNREITLWIAGQVESKYENRYKCNGVKFLGSCGDTTLHSLFCASNAIVHMVYADACPNVVVEALVAGCPVICSNGGGTHELIEACGPGAGLVLDNVDPQVGHAEDLSKRKWGSDHVDKLIVAFNKYEDNMNHEFCSEALHINSIAQKYIEFLGDILCQPKK